MDTKKAKKLARERKGMGARISNLDIARMKRAAAKKGQKPVLKTGTKETIKGLTQKSKPMTAAQKAQIKKFKDALTKIGMPKRPKKPGMVAMRGMLKGAGSAGVMAAAKKAMRKKVKK